MVAFCGTLEMCEFVDLGFSDAPCTYDNMRRGITNVRVHLDRAVATNACRNLYGHSSVQHQAFPCSNHVPVVIRGAADIYDAGGSWCRQYEVLWERDTTLPKVIKVAWDSFGTLGNLGKVTRIDTVD